jgi:allophanate hydrolase subunit 1
MPRKSSADRRKEFLQTHPQQSYRVMIGGVPSPVPSYIPLGKRTATPQAPAPVVAIEKATHHD